MAELVDAQDLGSCGATCESSSLSSRKFVNKPITETSHMNNTYELEQNGLMCRINVTIPKEKVSQTYSTELNKICQNAQVKGFRKGRLNVGAAQQMFGSKLELQLQQQFQQDALQEALEDHKVEVAGSLDLEDGSFQKNDAYHFVLKFERIPDVDVKPLENIKLPRLVAKVDEKLLADDLADLKKKHPSYEEVKRKSKNDDQVIMDFEGFVGEKAFENGSAKDFEYIVGSGKLLPEFDKALIGVKKDDELDLNVSFPEDYHGKEMAGKKALFKVRVHAVKGPKEPKMNDEFFAKVGSQHKDLEAFDKERAERLQAEVDEMSRNIVVAELKKSIGKLVKADLPKSLLDPELERLSASEPDEKKRLAQAESNVLASIVFKIIVKENNIQLDENRFKDFLTRMSGPYAQNPEFVKWYMSDENRRRQVAALVLEEQIIDHILAKAVFTDKEIEYNKLKEKTKEL